MLHHHGAAWVSGGSQASPCLCVRESVLACCPILPPRPHASTYLKCNVFPHNVYYFFLLQRGSDKHLFDLASWSIMFSIL